MQDVTSDEAEALAMIHAAGFEPGPDQDVPLFHAEAIAAALYDASGKLLAASAAFERLRDATRLDERCFGRVAAGGAPTLSVSELALPDGTDELAVFAYGALPAALGWRLPAEIRAACERHRRGLVVLTAHAAAGVGPLESACRAFGLTGLQTRIALETLTAGNVRLASARANVAYETGREALAEAFRKVGVTRLPALIARLASHAFGVLPDADPGAALAELWGLTPRQASIAALVGQGASRDQAAHSLGLGGAVVRKELEHVFELLQVSSAAALARKVVEAQALRWILQETNGEVAFLDAAAEPLQYVSRPQGGRIAVSDYGPPGGRPVLVVHSSMTSRIVARRLVRALHAEGFRPLSIDRPGFGLSDEVPGARPGGHDPYVTAAADAVTVLDRLKIRRIDVVARGGAQFVAALQRLAPERIAGVVLVNPDPHTTAESRDVGPYGWVKHAYRRNPALIRLIVAGLVKGLTYQRTARMLQAWMQGSAPDEVAVTDPELVTDYYRAQRMFALGKYAGYVNEQLDFARGAQPAPLPGLSHWEVLVAMNDTLHDPAQVFAYWRTVLPDSVFRPVEEAGRLMALSHPHLVTAALARSIAADPREPARGRRSPAANAPTR